MKAYLLDSRNLTSSFCGSGSGNAGNILAHGRGVRQEPQSSSTPTPRFNQEVATLNPIGHTGRTYSHGGMMYYPIFPISEMHLGKFPDSLEFQSWKDFKTEVCSKSAVLHITMQWFKEVKTAKSNDELMTSRSIVGRKNRMQWIKEVEIAMSIEELMMSLSIFGRTDFPDYDMLDAMFASAMEKLITSVHFQKRVTLEKQRAQKYDRFLRGRQIAFVPPELMKLYTVYQIFSIYDYRTTMSKISIDDGTKLHYQQVQHLQEWSWSVETSQNCRILFSLRLCWLCMNNKTFKTMR